MKSNSELAESLAEALEISKKLEALDEEIEADPNVLQLKEIMAAASKRQPTLNDAINNLPPFSRSLVLLSREMVRALRNVIEAIR